MASPQQVKQYLSYWFQLGKKLQLKSHDVFQQPERVFSRQGNYAPEFEAFWQQILAAGGKQYYLEGTGQTIEELLSPSWEIDPCARCSMPIPVLTQGLPCLDCPCQDLEHWPNTELPQPRSSVNTLAQLAQVRNRLNRF